MSASGRFHSDDELSVWAVAASLAGRGEVTIDQLAWNQDLSGGIGRSTADGHVYSKYGPGLSLLLTPILWVVQSFPSLSPVASSMLLAGPFTSATCSLLYLSARRFDIAAAPAAALALAYGLATPAWVYARFLFGEPFVAFGALLAFLLLFPKHELRPWRASAAGCALAMAVLVRSSSLVALPAMLLLLWSKGGRAKSIAVFLVPIAIALAGVAGYNQVRFGNPFDTGYDPIEGFSTPLEVGLFGLLMSPGRGLLFYSPLALAAVAGIPMFLRRNLAGGLSMLLFSGGTVVLFAKWHAWYGGWSWGPRLILPAIPFILLLSSPLFERATKSLAIRIALAVLTVAGLFVNALAVLVDFNLPLIRLLAEYPEAGAGVVFPTLFGPSRSPIVEHLYLLPSAFPDLAWWVGAGQANWLWGGAGLALVAFCVGLTTSAWNGNSVRRWAAPLATAVVGIVVGSAAIATHHPVPREDVAGRLATAIDSLATSIRSGDRMLIVGVGGAETVLDRVPIWMQVAQILPEVRPDAGMTLASEQRIRRSVSGRRLWLVQDGAPPTGEDNGIELRVDQLSFKTRTTRHDRIRVTEYRGGGGGTRHDVDIAFASQIALTGWSAEQTADVALIRFWWQALRRPGGHYVVSARIVDDLNRVVAQLDREPTDGALPTDEWKVGEEVAERLAIALPISRPSQNYRLAVVVYDRTSGRPLLSSQGENPVLGTVEIPEKYGTQ